MSFKIPEKLVRIGQAAGPWTTIGCTALSIWQEMETRAVLREQIAYLKNIDAKLDSLLGKVDDIIARLDALPEMILRGTRVIVEEQALEERYNDINAAIESFYFLPETRPYYRITEQGWRDLYEDIRYVIEYENRISRYPRLLKYIEFAVFVTNGAAKHLMDEKIKGKIVELNELMNGVEIFSFNEARMIFKTLNNTHHRQFLLNEKLEVTASHNFDKELKDIKNLSFAFEIDEVEMERRAKEYACHFPKDPGGSMSGIGGYRAGYFLFVKASKNVLREARETLNRQVNKAQTKLTEHLERYSELKAIKKVFENFKNYDHGLKEFPDDVLVSKDYEDSIGIFSLSDKPIPATPYIV